MQTRDRAKQRAAELIRGQVEERVTVHQIHWLASLVAGIVEIEQQTRPYFDEIMAWDKLRQVLDAPDIPHLRRRDFYRAKTYLESWLRLLRG